MHGRPRKKKKATVLEKGQKTLVTMYQPINGLFIQEEFELLLVAMFVQCNLSFNLIGNENFRRLLTYLKQDLKLFSPKTLKARILDL